MSNIWVGMDYRHLGMRGMQIFGCACVDGQCRGAWTACAERLRCRRQFLTRYGDELMGPKVQSRVFVIQDTSYG